MKGIVVKIVLWVVSVALRCDLKIEDIPVIRLIARGKVRFSEADTDSIRLVAKHGLRFGEEDIGTIRVVANEGLRFGQEDASTIRVVANEGLRFGQEDASTIRVVANEGLRFGQEDASTIRVVANEGLRFGQEDVATIRILVREGLQFQERDIGPVRMVVTKSLQFKEGDLEDLGQGIQLCYSQEGESLILDRYFSSQETGFYVDVGAHHPKRFSNTYALYKRGWRGISIDPTPGVQELFSEVRPADVFLPVAVSSVEQAQDFYMFNEPALNTFSKSLAEEYRKAGYEVVEVRPIESKRLSTLLDACHVEQPIDFMSVDVEDHELQVLESNDWGKFRPRLLLVEILNFDLHDPGASPVHSYLSDRGYVLFAKTYNTVFYRDAA
jgi:FkbM family methyltransferase